MALFFLPFIRANPGNSWQTNMQFPKNMLNRKNYLRDIS